MNMDSQPSTGEDAAVERNGRWVILLIPFVVHLMLIGKGLIAGQGAHLGRIDYLIFAISFSYLVVAGFAVGNRTRFFKLVSLVYTTMIALVLTGALGKLIDASVPNDQWLPHYPGKSVLELNDAIPGTEISATFSVNRYGVRGDNYNLANTDLGVLCIGGSTTECRAVTDEESWPWVLEAKLSEKLNKQVSVGNAGRSGHFLPHHIYQIEHYTFLKEFDWVVVLAGINDLGRAFHGDYERRLANIDKESLLFNEPPEGLYYRHLFLVRKIRAFIAYKKLSTEGVVVENYDEKIAGIRANRQRKLKEHAYDSLPENFTDAVQRYEQDIEKLFAAAESKGVKLLMLTQPTTWLDEMTPEQQSMLCAQVADGAYTTKALAEGIARLNEALMRTARKHNVAAVDLADRLPKDFSMMYDDCHFTPAGCEDTATIVAEALLERIK